MVPTKENHLLLPQKTSTDSFDRDIHGADGPSNSRIRHDIHLPYLPKHLLLAFLIFIPLVLSNAIFAAKYLRLRQRPSCPLRSSYSRYTASAEEVEDTDTNHSQPRLQPTKLAAIGHVCWLHIC